MARNKAGGPTPRASNKSGSGGGASVDSSPPSKTSRSKPGGGLSTSMIAAVNDAAETARLVMDQAEHDRRRKAENEQDDDDDGSLHSLHSQTTKTSGNAFGAVGIGAHELTDDDEDFPTGPGIGNGSDIGGGEHDSTPDVSRRRSGSSSLDKSSGDSSSASLLHLGSTGSAGGGPAVSAVTGHFASPPPMDAFANIPPMGTFAGDQLSVLTPEQLKSAGSSSPVGGGWGRRTARC